ncbi:YfgG family protein [Escherichia coli]|nr:YfgG family protein [Escherichia coli]
MSQATSMRKRHRFNSRMTRIVLLISFIFFFGRFYLLSVGALAAPSEQKEAQQSTLSVESPVQR